MQITFDSNNLTELDIKILDTILAEADPAEEAPEPVAAPKAEPKKTTKAAAAPAPEPDPVVAEDEDLLGGSAPTMSDAVARATALVSGGNAQAVKEALAELDVKRVSELADDQIATFLAALPSS